MNIGELLNDLSTKAGIKGDDSKLKDLLANPALASIVIPDEISGAITKELMNRESAKNDAGLRGYFHSQALAVPDKTIEEEMADLDDAAKAEIKAEQNTPKKIKLLKKKVAEAIEKKFATDPKDQDTKKKLQAEIDRLNAQIDDVNKGAQLKIDEMEKAYREKELKYDMRSFLAAKKFAYEKTPHDVNVQTAQNLLDYELASKKVKVVRDSDGRSLRLVQAETPELDYFENNKKVTFGDFADKVLANNNLLYVSNPERGKTNGQTVTNGKTIDASRVVTANTAQIAQLEREQAQ